MTTAKTIVSAILTRLATIDIVEAPNEGASTSTDVNKRHRTLSTLPAKAQRSARPLLLALHFLFPHEFLPALDILDRRLLRCLCVQGGVCDVDANFMSLDGESSMLGGAEVFYVQSASSQQEHSHFVRGATATSHLLSKQYYEVRLDSWNCSCAAFAQSSLRELLAAEGEGNRDRDVGWAEICNELGLDHSLTPEVGSGVADSFGGHDLYCSSDTGMPICKHILAAAVGKAAPAKFGTGVEVKAASTEEVAGMAAGWGDG